ncbi:TVP38/TMEM64 family protein [Thermodesulfobacteriota bacterium]
MKDPGFRRLTGRGGLALLGVLLVLGLLLFFYGGDLWSLIVRFFYFLSDREKTSAYIEGFGPAAPLVFMLVQVLQVLLAPVPGEATGFVGGYLFGVTKGFLFSSIALSIGSIINFGVGRYLGRRYVRKMIPPKYLARFDTVARREGALIVFILFVFPGFPKDYLCLFLGLSSLPFKVFFLMTTIGRMPGTFILSLQGAMLFEQNYMLLALATATCSGIVLLGYRYRESLYAWIEKQT